MRNDEVIRRIFTIAYSRHLTDSGSRKSLIAFVDQAKMVANAWMRTDDCRSGNNFTEFFDKLLTIIPVEKIGLFPAYSGFFNETSMDRLEHESLKYIMAASISGPVVRRIFEHKKWFPVDKGIRPDHSGIRRKAGQNPGK